MYGIIEKGSTGLPPSVPFEQPKNLFRYGEQTIWSTQLHTANAAIANGSFRLFSTPLGQVGQGFANALSIGETSLKEGGRIPAGIAFDIYGIACQIGRATGSESAGTVAPLGDAINLDGGIDALVSIQSNGILSWDFTQTQVEIAPIEMIGAGGGTFGSVALADTAGAGATVGTGNMQNGAGSVFLYRKHPVALPGNSTFSILLRYGSRCEPIPATNDFFVKVILMGYYKNVIEIG